MARKRRCRSDKVQVHQTRPQVKISNYEISFESFLERYPEQALYLEPSNLKDRMLRTE